MKNKKLIVMTGTDLRHAYFLNHLKSQFTVLAVFEESVLYPEPSFANEEERRAWDWFFSRRRDYENRVLGSSRDLPLVNQPEVIPMAPGTLNSPGTLARIKNFQPDGLAIFGTSLLEPEVLRCLAGRIFNLHVGLSGYCRGSFCNFWPVHNLELESLGATVHRVEPGIDTGDIAAQESIGLDSEDDEQTLAGKTLILGTRLMIATLHNWQQGTLITRPQQKTGRLYLKRDLTAGAILRVKRMVESGELRNRIAEKIEGGMGKRRGAQGREK
ncbi:MAG: formyl transferase [Nitrospinaceae bacterium]